MGQSFWKRLNKLQRVRPSLYRQERFEEVEDAVRRLIADASDAEQRNNARAILSSHHQFRGNLDGALSVIEAQIGENSNDLQA